jgi:hypothetical protein
LHDEDGGDIGEAHIESTTAVEDEVLVRDSSADVA